MNTPADTGWSPARQALGRRVFAALATDPPGSGGVVQQAIDAVYGNGLSAEWADLFVTLVERVHGGDRNYLVRDLAFAVRSLVDRVRGEPWAAAVVRELCSEAVKVSPVELVRRLDRWVDHADGRLALRAYLGYEGKCRPRGIVVEVRRALAELVVTSGTADLGLPARVLAETFQTAGEFGTPPHELSREVRGLAELLLAPKSLAHDRYALDGGLIRLFRERGFSVAHFISLNTLHGPSGRGPLLRAWLPTLLANGLTEGPLPVFLLTREFLPPGEKAPAALSAKAWDGLLQIVRTVQDLPHGEKALEVVFGQFRTPADVEKQVRPVGDLVRAWAARPGANANALRTALQQANVRGDGHSALLAAAGLAGQMSPTESSAFFLRYRADHAPHAERSAEATRYREKTFDVVRRLHNVAYGFTALKVVNQRMPDGGPSAFDEFGDDLFERLDLVNASSNEQFPGFGYVFVGPQMERLFAHDRDHPSDPLHHYRAAWTDPRRLRSTHLDLDRFADAEFAFVRGFVAVSVPHGDHAPHYEVAGTHLTLMVWNHHFPGLDGELAMLVPTSLYHERIRPCLMRCTELDQTHPDSRDACRASLDPESLRAECLARALPFVDLGSPSVAGGGLVNGFPPRLPPYHEWEAALPAHETRDGAGHIHKSHMLGGYRTRLGADTQLDHALQPLRDGNDLVFDVSSSLLNLLDIFFLSFATWHRGDTLDAIDFESVFDDDDRQQLAGADAEDDEPFNRRNTRILLTAYAVHDLLVEARAPRSAFRIYCSANPLHLHPTPEATVTFDTLDLTLVVRGQDGKREISFARDRVGSQERAEMLWVRHVLSYLRRTGFDLRPYDRAAVRELFPDG